MKNITLILSFIVFGILSSCSTMSEKEEKRAVASKDYECTFTDSVDGLKSSFVFTPDNLLLIVTSEKYGVETMFLEEDNFISGGFSYIQDKKTKSGQWPITKIEFISFTSNPKVTIKFQRTPASLKAKTITKFCE